ncbi:hypothetical protein IV417_16000 [Alphaproteobacteria bacterium KMM 3653]|uniref:Uncharacterized protein n=1 Tax=Harenicola maris TaxID=2841044 RepID=A0AAP2CWD5_9RHOB|nr:hypothetical protein [Harenicola maris]
MMLASLGRALALALFAAAPLPAMAHSLPGSQLTLTQRSESMQITLRLALDDLAHVLPEVAPLAEAPLGPVPQGYQAQMQGYFAKHIAFSVGQTALPLTLTQALLQQASNDHVGAFKQLEITFTAPLEQGTDAPLALSYDAIMHEIRSHRAAIYQDSGETTPIGLVEFGYDFETGKARRIPLP